MGQHEIKQGYYLGIEDGQVFILCYACDKKSFHPKDIEQLYCGNCHTFHNADSSSLKMWVIYGNPTDHPSKFVARLWLTDKPTDTLLIADSLEEVRWMLPPGLVCLARDPNDDPKIVEVWL
jgi:hypothetical protein